MRCMYACMDGWMDVWIWMDERNQELMTEVKILGGIWNTYLTMARYKRATGLGDTVARALRAS